MVSKWVKTCLYFLNGMYCGCNPLTFDPNYQRDIQVANWWFLVRWDHNFAKENHLNQTFTIVFHAQMLNVWPIYLHLGSFGGKRREIYHTLSIWDVNFQDLYVTSPSQGVLCIFGWNYSWLICPPIPGFSVWTNPEKLPNSQLGSRSVWNFPAIFQWANWLLNLGGVTLDLSNLDLRLFDAWKK